MTVFRLAFSIFLSFFSLNAFSSQRSVDTVNCMPAQKISDHGLYVDIKPEGSEYKYSFYSDSYAGRKVLREKSVTIGSLKTSSSCKLTVYSDDLGESPEPMFYIYKDNDHREWRLLGAGNKKVPPLICKVSLEFEMENCSSEDEFTPIGIRP